MTYDRVARAGYEGAAAGGGASCPSDHDLAVTDQRGLEAAFKFDGWYKDYWTRVVNRALPDYDTPDWRCYMNGRDVAGSAWRAALMTADVRAVSLDGLVDAVDTSAQLGSHVVSLVFVDRQSALRFCADLARIRSNDHSGRNWRESDD